MVSAPISFPLASSIVYETSREVGVILIKELKAVDTKLLSAPKSNMTGSTASVLMASPLAVVVLHSASPSVVQLRPVAERVVYVIIFSLRFVLIIPSSLCSHNLIDEIMSHTYGFPT
ncbi:hypothetical protein Tco_0268246 [Tanacetum coccineum]